MTWLNIMKNFGLFNLIFLLTLPSHADMIETVVHAGLKQTGYDKKIDEMTKNFYNKLVDKEYQEYVEYTTIVRDVVVTKSINLKWEF